MRKVLSDEDGDSVWSEPATTKPTISKADELDEILFGAFVGMWCRDENGNFVSLDDKYGVLKDSLKKDFQEYLADQQRQLLDRVEAEMPNGDVPDWMKLSERPTDYIIGYSTCFANVQAVIKDIREGLRDGRGRETEGND